MHLALVLLLLTLVFAAASASPGYIPYRRPPKPPRKRLPVEMPLWKAVGYGILICAIVTLLLLPFFPH